MFRTLTGDGQSGTANLYDEAKMTTPRGQNAIDVFAVPERE
jgi:hypothetical protein